MREDHEKCTTQSVEIVEKIVKFHLNQDKTNLSIVTNVFKIINLPDQAVDLVAEIDVPDMVAEMTEVEDLREDHEKCTKQPVQIVEMNVRYHSNQKMQDLFIVTNVSKNINRINTQKIINLLF